MGTEEDGMCVCGVDQYGRARIAREDQVHTKGRFLSRGFAFDAPGDPGEAVTTKHWWKIPFQTDVLAGVVRLSDGQAGHVVRFVGNPNTDLKTALELPAETSLLQSAISQIDISITFIPEILASLVAYALIDEGMWELTFDTGDDEEGPYIVTEYDTATGEVMLDSGIKEWHNEEDEPADWAGFTNAHGTDVKITFTRVFIDNFELSDGPMEIVLGATSAQSAPMPAGAVLCAEYTVPVGGTTTRVRGSLDLLTGQNGGVS